MKATFRQFWPLPLGIAAIIALGPRPWNRPRESPPAAWAKPAAARPLAPLSGPAGGLERAAVARFAPAAPVDCGPDAPSALIHAQLRALREIQTGDTEAQDRLMKTLLATLTDGNAADITLSLSPEELDTPFGTAALDRWLGVDPTAAADWIAAQPGTTEEQARVVARRMLGAPGGLPAYCDDLPDGAWKQKVLAAAGLTLVAEDPAAAARLAGQMDPGAARTDSLETVAYDWASRDPAAALAWINQVEDPVLRERLSAVGAKALAVSDPSLATEWLAATVKSAPRANDTALCIVETWGGRDPAGAASWVSQLADPAPREAAVDIVLRHWLQSDPDAAVSWVETLPERDKVLAKLWAALDADTPPA